MLQEFKIMKNDSNLSLALTDVTIQPSFLYFSTAPSGAVPSAAPTTYITAHPTALLSIPPAICTSKPDGGRDGEESREVRNYVDRRTLEPRWELQLVGAVERSAMGWAFS